MKIYPKDWVKPDDSKPLEVSKAKKTAMVKKAKELFDKPIEKDDLVWLLEQHYISAKGEHYTSAQLREVVEQVAKDLYVEPSVENPS